MSRTARRAVSTARRPGRRIPWATATVALGVVVALVFGACAGKKTVPRTSPVPATEESLATGARLYENRCQICHGPQGRGGNLAPDLTVHVPTREDGFLFARISDGFPIDSDQKTMPAFESQLTETERWHLTNFLREAFGRITPVLPEETSP